MWVGDENFQDFVTASSTSEKNLINELSAHGVDTYLYTDKLSGIGIMRYIQGLIILMLLKKQF